MKDFYYIYIVLRQSLSHGRKMTIMPRINAEETSMIDLLPKDEME